MSEKTETQGAAYSTLRCPDCRGDGHNTYGQGRCEACQGLGTVKIRHEYLEWYEPFTTDRWKARFGEE